MMRSASPWRQSWQRLRRHHAALASLIVLAVVTLASLLIPWLSVYDYATPDWNSIFNEPSWHGGHVFGTDNLGRDMLVRVMWGCRVSLLVGILASFISVAIGTLWGVTAGFLGGNSDNLMMRLVDVLYSVPFIPLVIVLSVLFGRSFLLVFVAIGAVSWLDVARIVRAQTQSLRQREFVEAAQALGSSTPTIIMRHLLPNLSGTIAINATLTIPSVILFEALLSFLGLGVHAPLASLGSLVAEGANNLQSHPHMLIAPAILLAVIIYSFNYLGDGLRDALDTGERNS
jgi:oligopeptide transport system permease protein